MTDDLDKMLQGNDQSTAVTSQNQGQQSDATQTQSVAQQTEEEVEFNRLSGSTQNRIKELYKRARDAESRAQQQQSYVPPAPNTITTDQKQALETLSQFGVATDEKVERKLNEGLNTIKWDLRMQNLESKHSGQDGLPKFDREEVEDYMRNHSQYQYYDPEDVYKFKMFPDEFFTYQGQTTGKTRSQSLKPTKAMQRTDALTPEYIEERLSQPDGNQWYEDHLDEINKVVYNHTQQFKDQNFGQ